MLKITAISRFVDLQNSFKIYYVIALGVLVSVLIFVAYRDILGMVTMLACTAVLYFILSQKPTPIQVIIGEENLVIDNTKIDWTSCIGWAMLDLGTKLEFVVQTSQISQSFYYFYLEETDPNLKELIMTLNQFLSYSEEIPSRNWLHNLFRRFGLK